jgi:hypothetical protein
MTLDSEAFGVPHPPSWTPPASLESPSPHSTSTISPTILKILKIFLALERDLWYNTHTNRVIDAECNKLIGLFEPKVRMYGDLLLCWITICALRHSRKNTTSPGSDTKSYGTGRIPPG